jgi:outer membrane biosynthesis protein TonB
MDDLAVVAVLTVVVVLMLGFALYMKTQMSAKVIKPKPAAILREKEKAKKPEPKKEEKKPEPKKEEKKPEPKKEEKKPEPKKEEKKPEPKKEEKKPEPKKEEPKKEEPKPSEYFGNYLTIENFYDELIPQL